MIRKRGAVGVALVLFAGLALLLATAAGAELPPGGGPYAVFFPVVQQSWQPAVAQSTPTLGPSPTPTRTVPPTVPTAGPSPTPTATATPPDKDVEVSNVASDSVVWPGQQLVLSVGFLNHMPADTVRITLTEVWPAEMTAFYYVNLNCPYATLDYTSTWGTAIVDVGPDMACQIVVAVEVISICGNCYARDTVNWQASWSGGARSGTSYSQQIHILDVAPPPTVPPTVAPSATPSPGPTMGPSPTRTPTVQPTLGPSPTPGG